MPYTPLCRSEQIERDITPEERVGCANLDAADKSKGFIPPDHYAEGKQKCQDRTGYCKDLLHPFCRIEGIHVDLQPLERPAAVQIDILNLTCAYSEIVKAKGRRHANG